jgi:hypothetical protein
MKILFVAGSPAFYLRQYGATVTTLVERGHRVHLLFKPAKGEDPLDAVRDAPAGVTLGIAPTRGVYDGWGSVAWLVRGLQDLARYTHPRFEHASVLRERITTRTLQHLQESRKFGPVGRRLGIRVARKLAATTDAALADRTIARLAGLEAGIPTSEPIDRFIRGLAPDVVLATPVVNQASPQVDFLKSARKQRIPTGIAVASWDNLTNKGLLKFTPDRVFVWNEIQRQEAIEQHGIPPVRVVATGAQLFDPWFERTPSKPRDEFMREAGVDPARPYVLYTCSNPRMTETPEEKFVLGWIESLRASGDERLRSVGVLIRPHPSGPDDWRDVDLSRFENVAVWPRHGGLPVSEDGRAVFFDSLVHSTAVVGINTTAMIEAAIAGKSVLTVLAPEFAQETTLHFFYLLEENGGFLHVAASLDEHAGQLAGVLERADADAEQRRRFVESFVRPHGLDCPATPILADEIEKLAELQPDPYEHSARLQALLSLVAAESAAALLLKPVRRRRRKLAKLRKRVVGKARRHGLLPGRAGS